MSYDILYRDLSYQIIGACFTVHSKLGPGLPESCYNHALVYEFNRLNISCTQQDKFSVYYNDEIIGHFFTDLIVDRKIIIELKADDRITPNHLAQLFTYLKVCKLKVGYLVAFGAKSLLFKRLIL